MTKKLVKKEPKSNLLEHSKAKVRLLGKYLERYLAIITNDKYTERIKIYDLYCGVGVYDNEEEGSPLVILRTINQLHAGNITGSKYIIPIDCHFNDIEKVNVGNVENAIKLRSLYNPNFGDIVFTVEDYQHEIRKILEVLPKLTNQKIFIFIDPYGYKDIKPSDIKSLLESKNSEILLFLPTQFMYRFDKKGTPQALKDFNEELGIAQENLGAFSTWQYIDLIKAKFRAFLGEEFFVDTFAIEKDPHTVFSLFFFSSHIRGFEKMLETKWEVDAEEGKGYSYTGNNPTLFFDSKTNPLEILLLEYLQEQPRYNGQIYEFTLRCGFLPSHANGIFKNWQNNFNKLSVVNSMGEEVRRGWFYNDYDNYKNDYKKVTFKLI